jgi:methanogenic corrinoid protein MtbC1
MITEEIYRYYFASLLAGDHRLCHTVVAGLLTAGVKIRELYVGLFQRSLYEVGEMWEHRRISVAVEHMASAITESLLTLVYPAIFSAEHSGKSVVISCVANEYHQIGSKMVADFFELNGWHGYFLGASTPEDDLLRMIDDKQPQLIGLSLSLSSNLPTLIETTEAITGRWPESQILVGGQAFRNGGSEMLSPFANVRYVASLGDLESVLVGA